METIERHYTNQTCEPCLARFVGPALERVVPNTERTDWCAGCGQTTTVVRASYWFPWPDEA